MKQWFASFKQGLIRLAASEGGEFLSTRRKAQLLYGTPAVPRSAGLDAGRQPARRRNTLAVIARNDHPTSPRRGSLRLVTKP